MWARSCQIEAHFEKGVLHLKVKKPTEVEKAKKTIEIKAGPPQSPAAETAGSPSSPVPSKAPTTP
jgi:HSP20 family protein